MKTILLKGEIRTELGSRTSKALRAKGMVPCVLYGGNDVVHFGVYEADFKNLVYTPNVYKVKLDLNGKSYDAILKDMQFHAVSEAIIHADFYQTSADKPVVMNIPVKVTGNSPGVRAGGKLVKKIDRLQVRGFIQDMPDFIETPIDSLELGQSLRVKAIQLDKLQILDAPENAIITIKATRASAQEAAAAADGKKK